MIQYTSTKGSISPVNFDEAILSGFASDGGLFVPNKLPIFSTEELKDMADLSYQELAFKIVRPFIGEEIIPNSDLQNLLDDSFKTFSAKEVIPISQLGTNGLYIQELFHGPTLSFKDIAMGFLINCMDYFLTKKNESLSLILATTGDTGPAAAHASVGKKSIQCWPLYPTGMISEEQERQMTTLNATNVHPVSVSGCKNGGDDLDVVVANLFADSAQKKKLQLSSVNSINWCRVMMQTVHYFHGYFKIVDSVGEKVTFSVPAGAFGNLCAGFFARSMGLPVKNFICATNDNGTLHRVFQDGCLSKENLKQTVSSAIDIVVPYNLWRFLYFSCDCDPQTIQNFMNTFEGSGKIIFDKEFHDHFRKGFISSKISDTATLETMKAIYTDHNYLLDPHGAVAVKAASDYRQGHKSDEKILCLATAHPAKFPDIVELARISKSSQQTTHSSIQEVSRHFQHQRTCSYEQLEEALIQGIKQQLKQQA